MLLPKKGQPQDAIQHFCRQAFCIPFTPLWGSIYIVMTWGPQALIINFSRELQWICEQGTAQVSEALRARKSRCFLRLSISIQVLFRPAYVTEFSWLDRYHCMTSTMEKYVWTMC